jgi:alkylhydroperoxidase family enzyme
MRLIPSDESARLGEQLGMFDWLAAANVGRGLLHSPAAARAVNGMLDALIFHNTVPNRTRELVILRIGWRANAEYVFAQHVRYSRELGISDDDILGARDPARCQAFGETDRRVIDLADELYDSACVTPSTWAALERAFTPQELVELVLIAGFWRAIAGFVNTAQIPLDDGLPGWP